MKKKKMQFRTKLHVSRLISRNRVYDAFVVYCTSDIVDAVRNSYKSRGYTVSG